MPTETEYRTAATNINRYCGVATNLGSSLTDLITNPGLEGGRCAKPIGTSLDAMSVDATDLGTNLVSLERELLTRATQCAAYTAEIRRWQSDMSAWTTRNLEFLRHQAVPGSQAEHPGRVPMMPVKPFPEAEAG